MACGLEEYELYILEELFDRRCFNSDHSFNLKRIYKGYKRRFNREAIEVAKKLSTDGYITRKRKSDPKYYISNRQLVERVLGLHNRNVILGRIRHL